MTAVEAEHAGRNAEIPSATPVVIDGVECVELRLPDENRGYHTVTLGADDWLAAHALTPNWCIRHVYEKPQVLSVDWPARKHRQVSRDFTLRLANFIAGPQEGSTVRFINGNTLELVRSNLTVRPKGAPLFPKEPSARQLAKQAKQAAKQEAIEALVNAQIEAWEQARAGGAV